MQRVQWVWILQMIPTQPPRTEQRGEELELRSAVSGLRLLGVVQFVRRELEPDDIVHTYFRRAARRAGGGVW